MKLGVLALVEGLLTLVVVSGAMAYGETEAGPRELRFVLAPTVAAPVGASAVVEFGGPAAGVNTLSLRAQALGAGFYWLKLVRKSDGATLRLGPFGVSDPDDQPDRQANSNVNVRSSTHQAHQLGFQSTADLPKGWNPADITRVVVTDAEGNPLLQGQLVAGR